MGIINRFHLFVLLYFLFSINVFAQNSFQYEWYVKGSVRDGVLIYDKDTNQSLYIDLLSTNHKINKTSHDGLKLESGEKATIIEASISRYNQYFYKSNNNLYYTCDLLKKPFLVNDTTLNIDWILHNDTKQIDGFNCKKATTNFKGRDWEIWYTTEIPISYGPWKFYGLPGLIIIAKEGSDQFWFRLTKIKIDPSIKIEPVNRKEFKEVSFKQFISMEEEVLWGDANGLFVPRKEEDRKRNGIELFFEWNKESKK